MTQNPENKISRRENFAKQIESKNSVDQYLLNLYSSILLSENKKLLANIISKKQIILTKEDMEEVIRCQIGKKCVIEFEDPDITCCGKCDPIFLKISSIRVLENENEKVDFKIVYNKDFMELLTKYHLCFKYVLVN